MISRRSTSSLLPLAWAGPVETHKRIISVSRRAASRSLANQSCDKTDESDAQQVIMVSGEPGPDLQNLPASPPWRLFTRYIRAKQSSQGLSNQTGNPDSVSETRIAGGFLHAPSSPWPSTVLYQHKIPFNWSPYNAVQDSPDARRSFESAPVTSTLDSVPLCGLSYAQFRNPPPSSHRPVAS